jgi:2-C-methyl-D-erythritol 4-phosphate cytidylyltransferase
MSTASIDNHTKCYALVPCAGVGERAGRGTPKQYRLVAGKSVVAHALDALARVPRIVRTLVVLAPGDRDLAASAPAFDGWTEACGGATRAQSVAAGLDALVRRGVGEQDWVLVHDAARCLVRPAAIERLIDACIDDAVGGLLALPMSDTLKQATDGERVAATLERAGKWTAQTPQMFRLGLLREALARAGSGATDEASAVEALGHAPRLVRGEPDNFKLTWPADFALAQRLLLAGDAGHAPDTRGTTMKMRIGEGWDTHALVAGRPLILGGVTIAHSHGLAGHSDADALAHAITPCLAPPRWAISGTIFRTPIQPSRAPTRCGCWPTPRGACARRASRSPTSTAPSSPRRRGWRHISTPCARAWPRCSAWTSTVST